MATILENETIDEELEDEEDEEELEDEEEDDRQRCSRCMEVSDFIAECVTTIVEEFSVTNEDGGYYGGGDEISRDTELTGYRCCSCNTFFSTWREAVG